jgi:ribosome-binding factor A
MSDRMTKVNELLAQQLGQIINTVIELPIGVIVTITSIDTAPNMRGAKVYLSVLPESEERPVMSLLINSVHELQQELNEKVNLRSVPKLKFIIDKTGQEAAKLDEILDNLNIED